MIAMRHVIRLVAIGVLASTLVGCGGGAGDQGLLSPARECSSDSVARLAVPDQAQQGRNVELALVSCGPVLSQLHWTQTAGPALASLSMRSPALSVEPLQPARYRFEVRFRDEQGRSHQGQAEFAVAIGDALALGLTVRGEPAVWAGGAVSVRAWPQGLSPAEQEATAPTWSVVDGPAVELAQAEGWALNFDAPQVDRDSLLRLRARLSLPDGRTATQDFSLLVQPPPHPAAHPLFVGSNGATRVYPYLEDGPYAAALADCVYAPSLSWTDPNNVCDLKRLPLLGQATNGAVPSVEQVMQRVVVSNDWMAEVFENFLRTQDSFGDFRRMLAATTAVVIGGRVKPSYYWNVTGAIYLDADHLWLTPEQRDTVSEASDPRSGFAGELDYSSPWRYVLNNRYAQGSYPVQERKTRDLAALRYDLGWLLYHELTHAADFIPPRIHTLLRADLHVYDSSPALTASLDLLRVT